MKIEDKEYDLLYLSKLIYPLTSGMENSIFSFLKKLAQPSINQIQKSTDTRDLLQNITKHFDNRCSRSKGDLFVKYKRLIDGNKVEGILNNLILNSDNYKLYLKELRPMLETNTKIYAHIHNIFESLLDDDTHKDLIGKKPNQVLDKYMINDITYYYYSESVDYLYEALSDISIETEEDLFASLDYLPLITLTLQGLYSIGNWDWDKESECEEKIKAIRDNIKKILIFNSKLCNVFIYLIKELEKDYGKDTMTYTRKFKNKGFTNEDFLDTYQLVVKINDIPYDSSKDLPLNMFLDFLDTGLVEPSVCGVILSALTDDPIYTVSKFSDAISNLDGAIIGENVNLLIPYKLIYVFCRNITSLEGYYSEVFLKELFLDFINEMIDLNNLIVGSTFSQSYDMYEGTRKNARRYLLSFRKFGLISQETLDELGDILLERNDKYIAKLQEAHSISAKEASKVKPMKGFKESEADED